MKTHLELFWALPLLAACGASSPAPSDAGQPAVDSGEPADASVPGDAGPPSADGGVPSPLPLPFYEVPVDDPSLAPHAFFAVPDVHYVVSGGTVTLTYDFPEDLSGMVDQEIVLSGPVDASGNATVSGAVGTGTCEVTAGVVRCLEHFTALPLDADAARSFAATYSTSEAAVAARREVIDRFVADPIGIVVFDLVTASEPTDD